MEHIIQEKRFAAYLRRGGCLGSAVQDDADSGAKFGSNILEWPLGGSGYLRMKITDWL